VLMVSGDVRGLGVYSVATQIYDVLLILPTSVGMVIFPRLVKTRAGAWPETRAALVGTLVLIAASCALAVGLGPLVLPAVFGRAFADAYEPMLGLLPAVVCISAVSILSQFVVARGFPILLVLTWLAGLGVTVLTAFKLYNAHGITGLAWSQSIGAAVVLAGLVGLSAEQISRDRRAEAEEGC